MKIIKIKANEMNPEKAINYLITHHAALKVEGYKETAAAVSVPVATLLEM